MSDTVTEGIRVQATPAFWPERSETARGLFAFTYTIRITNEGDRPAKLLRRRWHIQDGAGEVDEVEGEGVVGKQPNLAPGESFEYTSWVPLGTPIGTMRGSFRMERPDGSTFEAEVGEFLLALQEALH